MRIDYRRTLLEAITHWGLNSQIDMAIEEMSELIQELARFKRVNRYVSDASITSEIADVEIMMEQMKVAFQINDKVEDEKENKLKRLRKMLREENNE